jgi:DNA-binding transcriptional ArsR family regulator
MSTPGAHPTIPAPPPQVIPADTAYAVYAALGDPTRRRLLQILAEGQGRTATVLTGNLGKRREDTSGANPTSGSWRRSAFGERSVRSSRTTGTDGAAGMKTMRTKSACASRRFSMSGRGG